VTNLILTYTNAVLLAVLPDVTRFGEALNLRIGTVTSNHVQSFHTSSRDTGVESYVRLQDGKEFWHQNGRIKLFISKRSLEYEQSLERLPSYYGTNNLSQEQAVKMAERAIHNLGADTGLLIDGIAPKVTNPQSSYGKVFPRFQIEWPSLISSEPRISIEINSQEGVPESLSILDGRFSFPLNTQHHSGTSRAISIGSDLRSESNQMVLHSSIVERIAKVIAGVGKYQIPSFQQITTNTPFFYDVIGGAEVGIWNITLTNFYRLHYYEPGDSIGMAAPDSLFHSGHTLYPAKKYSGKWKLTKAEIIAQARAIISRGSVMLGVLVQGEPEIRLPRPEVIDWVPRMELYWHNLAQSACIEVDAESGEVKYFSVSDQIRTSPLADSDKKVNPTRRIAPSGK
jgi:hypothetical protein